MDEERARKPLFSFVLPKEWLTLLLLLISGLFLGNADAATPPPIITYQGKLLVNSASATTTRAMGFLLYDAETGGSVVYTAGGSLASTSTINVTPTQGIFSVDLGGSGTNAIPTSTFQNNHTLYLEVIVAGQVMTPRKRITSLPYAINSEYLMGLAATSTSSSTYIPHSNEFGNFTFTGTPQSFAVSGGVVYINPSSSITNRTLFGIAVGNSERFRVDAEGDVFSSGTSLYSGTTTFTNLINIEGKVTSPTHRGAFSSTDLNGVRNVFVSGHSVFTVNATGNTLSIIDVLDPEHPRLKATSTVNDGRDVYVSGNYAYVTSHSDGGNRLNIFDISNIASPTLRGTIAHGDGGAVMQGPRGVVVQGKYAYVSSDGSDAIAIIDISDPGNPVHKGSISNATTGALGDPNNIFVLGQYLYAASNVSDSLDIIDISDAASPTLRGRIVHGQGGALLDGAFSVYVVGNIAYVTAAVSDALEIIDISNPASPRHLGAITHGSGGALLDSPFEVYISGKFAYVSVDINDAIEVVDISSSTNPVHRGSIVNGHGGALLDRPLSLTGSGNFLYVGSFSSNAVEVIDIGGAVISSADIGSAQVTNLRVLSQALFDESVQIRGGLSVNGSGLYVQGDIGISAASYTLFATNTIKFSHRAHFIASSSVGQNAYIFDTSSTMPTGLNFLSVRNNGADLFTLTSNGGFIATASSTVSGDFFVAGQLTASTLSIASSSVTRGGRLTVNPQGDLSASGTLTIFKDAFFIASSRAAASVGITTTFWFSHHAAFISSSTDSGSSTFIFDTATAFASNTATYIFSVRNGGFPLFSIASNGDVDVDGTITASSSAVGTPGRPGDLSERVDIAPDDTAEAGDVMMVDPDFVDTYRKTSAPYEYRVAGVIATNPTIVVGFGRTDHTVTLAMVGRVPVKVSGENGPIARGDLLVSASLLGHAMKYDAEADSTKPIGIVGIALDAFQGDTGSILVLLRSGWVNNNLSVQESVNGHLSAPIDLASGDLQGSGLINVASIRGAENRWEIDALGRFVTRVETAGGTKELYAMQSEDVEYVLSGSSALENGAKRIDFDETTLGIIDPLGQMKVVVTVTADSPGVFVTDKSTSGFTVREIGGGIGNATFDWIVVAERRIGEALSPAPQGEARSEERPPPPPAEPPLEVEPEDPPPTEEEPVPEEASELEIIPEETS